MTIKILSDVDINLPDRSILIQLLTHLEAIVHRTLNSNLFVNDQINDFKKIWETEVYKNLKKIIRMIEDGKLDKKTLETVGLAGTQLKFKAEIYNKFVRRVCSKTKKMCLNLASS